MLFERIFFIFIFLLFIPAVIYIPQASGLGLALPLNLLVCSGAALLMAVCWGAVSLRCMVITPLCRTMLLVGLLLALPIFFAQAEWRNAAIWRLAGIVAGMMFYFTWLQVSMTARQRYAVLYLILFAATAQAMVVLLQLFALSNVQGAFGILQQPDLLASLFATGLALALMAFLLPGFCLPQARAEGWRRRALAAMLALLSMALVWVQSGIGWLAGGVVLGGFVLLLRRRYPRDVVTVSSWVSCSALVAVVILLISNESGGMLHYASYEGVDDDRSSQLAMITKKPLFSWGYGGFEYGFQPVREDQTPPRRAAEIVRHPPGEPVLWRAEGGVAALLGVGMLAWAGLKLVTRARWRDRWAFASSKETAGEALALCLALLPMALNILTKSPFHLSALHGLVFLMLLAMLDRLVSPRLARGALLRHWRWPMLAFSLAILSVMTAEYM